MESFEYIQLLALLVASFASNMQLAWVSGFQDSMLVQKYVTVWSEDIDSDTFLSAMLGFHSTVSASHSNKNLRQSSVVFYGLGQTFLSN